MRDKTAVDWIAQLADLKEVDYRNTLALAALLQLLMEKGIVAREEFSALFWRMDEETLFETLRGATS